ncbi:hypothetical protein [Simiduia agarivorans]|uniref:hypothetical protein n=1 Tax=Simiduia agarivorans TaxID=447471 RepID=UPI001183DC32|nr:hypothetical protein [Simiduia agarivorans]
MRRLLILLLNLCLLLSLSAQALSAALHPCMGAAPVAAEASMDAMAGMDHSQHMGMGALESMAGMDDAADHSSMDCCEGADDCPMDQCVLLPATLATGQLQLIWIAGSAEYSSLTGEPASAQFPPYHPPYLA